MIIIPLALRELRCLHPRAMLREVKSAALGNPSSGSSRQQALQRGWLCPAWLCSAHLSASPDLLRRSLAPAAKGHKEAMLSPGLVPQHISSQSFIPKLQRTESFKTWNCTAQDTRTK